jgi:TolA-binding protein
MFSKLFGVIVFLAAALALVSPALGQEMPDASTRSGRERKEELPEGIRESLAERRLKDEEKQHQELLERGTEAGKLTGQIVSSFGSNQTLTAEDKKNLERLEKIVKKIRSDLGGEDDGDAAAPASLEDAVEQLKSGTLGLTDDLKKTTKISVSVSAIENANAVLKIVRFIKMGKF